uniref:S-layer homology domain-containing protein n=1 Tax=Desulfovirgula thermocuniculi TaxID=348842 RepID=UPI0004840746
ITRVELAAILSRVVEAKKVPLSGQAPAFADASAIPAWAKNAVETAAKAGIVSGYEDRTFRPDKPVTRAEAASMILRLLEKVK